MNIMQKDMQKDRIDMLYPETLGATGGNPNLGIPLLFYIIKKNQKIGGF